MRITPISEMKTKFDSYIKMCLNEPIVLTEKGQIIAVLLSVSDEEQLDQLVLAHSSRFQQVLKTGEQQIKEGKGISHEDFWQQMQAES
jgi:PHD/YefM family antitoxin component YafN of YafNO toxin-antitoxin module